MTDLEAVLAANAAFYRAFESLELAKMEKIWLRVPYIKCVHPGWPLLMGWGPVMESWSRIFSGTLAMRFGLADVQVEMKGDLAWVVLTEVIESEHRDGKMAGWVQATNLFERHEGRWMLVHHHGSRVEGPLDTPVQMH